jgi:molybdenum cofactor cytidylyltransferase
MLKGLGWRFVVSPGGGMANSLAAGIAAVHEDSQGALVALGDEPFIPAEVIERVVARFRSGGVHVVVPRYRGVRGHPVLFGRAVFPELMQLSGDHGARAVADRDPGRLAFVDIDLPKPVDVDTPEDLARLR